MANKSTDNHEDDTRLVPPGTGGIGPQTDSDGELNEEELDDVSGGLGKIGLPVNFMPTPPPISPVFQPQPPPITERQMPVPPPIKS